MGKKKNSKEELQRYLNLCKDNKKLKAKTFRENKFDYRILNKCAVEEGYKDFNEFLSLHNIKERVLVNITKEKAIDIILNKQSKIDRPLKYDDFRNPKYGEISISIVKKYWGTMNNMKKELGLEIIQEDMVCKHVDDISIYINDLHNICDTVYNNFNRKTINCHDIDKYTKLNMVSSSIRQNIRKISNLSIKSIIEGYNGFSYQREGCGIVNKFNDGETTKSKYEYIFSINLRDMGLSYNIDYKRDIKYRDFIKNYNGLLDCDYVIYVDNREIYIEIAGMLNGKEINYINNIPINETTNRKEKYRLKLMEKEQMLKNNNLEYYIIFPSDFNNINKLFNKLKLNK